MSGRMRLLATLLPLVAAVRTAPTGGGPPMEEFWGPTFLYDNGKYFGQTLCSETGDCEVPHGNGTYLTKDGKEVYSGEWWQGHMDGRGTRNFGDGRKYVGHFRLNKMDGPGKLTWPDGRTFLGTFKNNRMAGKGKMRYPGSGHERLGTMDDGQWVGDAVYVEVLPNRRNRHWLEHWENGTYEPSVKVFKRVRNRYTDIKVEVVCKAHAMNPVARLLKDGREMLAAEETQLEVEGEIATLTAGLPFSDEAFKVYTCMAMTVSAEGLLQEAKTVEEENIERRMQVRNPFFVESHGECGVARLPLERLMRAKRSTDEDAVVFDDAGNEVISARITEGRDAVVGEVPWQALVHRADDEKAFCGGVVISPWHVLTAAHCLFPTVAADGAFGPQFRPDEIGIRLGNVSMRQALAGKLYAVKRIYVHPEFEEETFNNDIAVVVLKEKIRVGRRINPVCLPEDYLEVSSDDEDTELKSLFVSGFGLAHNNSDEERGFYYPKHLQITRIVRRPLEDCFSPHRELAFKFRGHFCAGASTDERDSRPDGGFVADSCNGDSGGPVTYRDALNGRHYLVGLVSYTISDKYSRYHCGTGKGAVYVNVPHYLGWINSVRLDDLVDEYKTTDKLPYDKVDSPVFRAMFDELAARKYSQ